MGGPARQIIAFQPKLDALGIQSEVIVGQVDPDEGDLGEIQGFDSVVRLPALRRSLHPMRDYLAFRQISERLRHFKPHIVHTHMAKAGALGRLAALRAHVPVVLHTFHGHVLEGYFAKPVARGFLMAERFLARRSDALIAVSPSIRDELLDLGIGRPRQWRVMEAGLDLERLERHRPAAQNARRQLGLPPEVPLVGIVGRLVPIKDHETFFRAAARIAQVLPDAGFVVAGDGPLREQLKRRGRQLLGNKVKFTGWVQDLATLYAALDVVVLTSTNEGTPIALIEAGAAGKPVVATHVGGVPDVIVHESTGVLARPGDADEIARRVVTLLREPNRAKALGKAASEGAVARFSSARLAKDLVELYEELLNRKRVGVH